MNNAVANLLFDVSWALGSLAKLFNGRVNGAEVSLDPAVSSGTGSGTGSGCTGGTGSAAAAAGAAGGAALGAGSGRRRAAAVPWVMAATA